MGPGAWIITAIVLIQVVAGAVAKVSEGRKAKERRDAGLAKGEPGKPAGFAAKVSEQVASRTEALEELRRKRIEELRNRIVGASQGKPPVQASTRVKVDGGGSVPPVAVPPVAERPAERAPDRSNASQKSAQRKIAREKANRAKAASTARNRRGASRASQAPAKPASKQKAPVVAKSDSLKPVAEKSAFAREKSPIFNSAIALSGPGQKKNTASEGSAGLMHGMLQDPEKFRQAVLLSELLAPPVSLRPGGCGGAEQPQS